MTKNLLARAAAGSLFAWAVAGVYAAPLAMAADGPAIYGRAGVSVDIVTTDMAAGNVSTLHVASNSSYFGVKGLEYLGQGISLLYQIESNVDLDTGGNALATRNTFVGLSGTRWGSLLAGHYDLPYKTATRDLDMFSDTIADNRSLMGIAGAMDARLANVVAYTSPLIDSYTVSVATVAGAETALHGMSQGAAWSLAAFYNSGSLYGSLSYQRIGVGTPGSGTLGGFPSGIGGDSVAGFKLGGGYTVDEFQLHAVYEKISSSIGGLNALGRTNLYLAGKLSVTGIDDVKLAYTIAGEVNGTANTEASQLTLGYDLNLSNHTTLYALYTKLTNGSAQGYALSSAATSGGTGGINSAPSALSVGLKHSF